MNSFICLNCNEIDPPYDTNHRCLLCYSGSMVVVDKSIVVDLREYVETLRPLLSAQAKSVKISNMCLGWNEKGYKFNSVDDYIEHSGKFIHSVITSGESLDEVITLLNEVIEQ